MKVKGKNQKSIWYVLPFFWGRKHQFSFLKVMIEQNDKLPNGSRSLLNIAILFQEWVGIKFQNSFKMVLPRIESNLLLKQN